MRGEDAVLFRCILLPATRFQGSQGKLGFSGLLGLSELSSFDFGRPDQIRAGNRVTFAACKGGTAACVFDSKTLMEKLVRLKAAR